MLDGHTLELGTTLDSVELLLQGGTVSATVASNSVTDCRV